MTRFVCFNINGIRARQHQLEAVRDIIDPDVMVCKKPRCMMSSFPLKM